MATLGESETEGRRPSLDGTGTVADDGAGWERRDGDGGAHPRGPLRPLVGFVLIRLVDHLVLAATSPRPRLPKRERSTTGRGGTEGPVSAFWPSDLGFCFPVGELLESQRATLEGRLDPSGSPIGVFHRLRSPRGGRRGLDGPAIFFWAHPPAKLQPGGDGGDRATITR